MKKAIVILVVVVIAFVGLSSFNSINNKIYSGNSITIQLKVSLPTEPTGTTPPTPPGSSGNKKGTDGGAIA